MAPTRRIDEIFSGMSFEEIYSTILSTGFILLGTAKINNPEIHTLEKKSRKDLVILLLSSLITIYHSKKENTNFLDYCYSLVKIISRNTVKESKNLSKNFKSLAKGNILFGTNKAKGTSAHKIIYQYKNSKKIFFNFCSKPNLLFSRILD